MLSSTTVVGTFAVLAATAAGSAYQDNSYDSYNDFFARRTVDDAEFTTRELVMEEFADGSHTLVARTAGPACPSNAGLYIAGSVVACAAGIGGLVYGCYQKAKADTWKEVAMSQCGTPIQSKTGTKSTSYSLSLNFQLFNINANKDTAQPDGHTEQKSNSRSPSPSGKKKQRRSILLTDEEANEVLFRRYAAFLDDIDSMEVSVAARDLDLYI